MKNMKKILALVLAAMMLLSMTAAFAANGANITHTITITNNDQVGRHTYDAYQVFAGDYDSTSHKLSNITWGRGVDDAAILAAVKADTTTFGAAAANAATAEDVAKLLSTGTDTAIAKKFAEIVGAHLSNIVAGTSATGTGATYAIEVTGDGFYFIKDKANTLPSDGDNANPQKGDSETRYIIQVVGDVSISAKSSTVQSEKKVGDTNDTTGDAATGDSSDYDVGDKIPYTLTATLPSRYAEYEHYYLKFEDDMSAGLTLDTTSVRIFYGASDTTGTPISFTPAEGTSYTGGQLYTYPIPDLKAVQGVSLTGGDVIRITYKATLNDSAVIGEEGNPNKSRVEFFNNPNNTGDGAPTSTTPWDTVISFTYDVEIDKVTGDATPAALTGAAFSLYKLFKDDATLTAVNADRANDKQYTKVTEIKYDNDTKTYPIGNGEVWALVVAKAVNSANNVFNFSGVDDGTYLLVETTTPAGYNSIKPSKFTITAPHTNGDAPGYGTPTAASVDDANHAPINLGTLTRNSKNVGLTGNVVNNSGVELPSTGGIGTTLFYVGGGILVLAAIILLVTKKRMSAND